MVSHVPVDDAPDTRSNALDRLSRLAAALMEAPIAHVTLLAGDRQHYRGSHGLPAEVIVAEGMPLTFGFCPTVIASGMPLCRGDLAASEFRDNPAVVEHGARAYAGTPLRSRDGAVIGTLCVLDVVAREWAAARLPLLEELAASVITELELVAALVDAEERAEATRVIAHLNDGVVLLDERRTVRIWNPAAERLTGIRARRAIGRCVDDLLEGWPTRGVASRQLRLSAGDDERVIDVIGSEWEAGAVYAARDVTADQKLATMRDELVATISHELRTPLASIYAASITLQRPEVPLDTATTATLLAMMEEQAARLTDLCDAVLIASQLDHGGAPGSRRAVDLARLVRDVASDTFVRDGRSARLAYDMEDDVVAAGDLQALRRVLVNLIDNAFKYSPPLGTVHVAARSLGPDAVELVVEDDGGGIPLAERELVFEKFYRRDPHMRDGVGGTGLGLHISRALVHGMGGQIHVGDASGGRAGAAVHVVLDAHPPAAS